MYIYSIFYSVYRTWLLEYCKMSDLVIGLRNTSQSVTWLSITEISSIYSAIEYSVGIPTADRIDDISYFTIVPVNMWHVGTFVKTKVIDFVLVFNPLKSPPFPCK